jgi:nitrate reductase beta subunit
MLFYVPPMLPIQALVNDGRVEATQGNEDPSTYFGTLEQARLPLRYMARLFAAGNEAEVAAVYRKLLAVRIYRRAQNVSEGTAHEVGQALRLAGITAEQAQAIFELTARPTFDERFVVPPLAREENIESVVDPFTHKAEAGFGFRRDARRGQ